MRLREEGIESNTIHSTIYRLVERTEGKPVFELKGAIEYDLLVIDEYSMVNDRIGKDLESFGKKILVVGDIKQLPPIGDTWIPFGKSDYNLTKIMRQAADSNIVRVAYGCLSGKLPNYGTYKGVDTVVVAKDIKDEVLARADTIIVARNKTRHRINKLVRSELGFTDVYPQAGDKLICTKNKWDVVVDGQPLINGMTGTCMECKLFGGDSIGITFKPDHTDDLVFVEVLKGCFDPSYEIDYKRYDIYKYVEFDFGYAVTAHKCQGSTIDNVVIINEVLKPSTHPNWLYTAITRARRALILVC